MSNFSAHPVAADGQAPLNRTIIYPSICLSITSRRARIVCLTVQEEAARSSWDSQPEKRKLERRKANVASLKSSRPSRYYLDHLQSIIWIYKAICWEDTCKYKTAMAQAVNHQLGKMAWYLARLASSAASGSRIHFYLPHSDVPSPNNGIPHEN
jgi:hypothetical protein